MIPFHSYADNPLKILMMCLSGLPDILIPLLSPILYKVGTCNHSLQLVDSNYVDSSGCNLKILDLAEKRRATEINRCQKNATRRKWRPRLNCLQDIIAHDVIKWGLEILRFFFNDRHESIKRCWNTRPYLIRGMCYVIKEGSWCLSEIFACLNNFGVGYLAGVTSEYLKSEVTHSNATITFSKPINQLMQNELASIKAGEILLCKTIWLYSKGDENLLCYIAIHICIIYDPKIPPLGHV